MIHNKYYEQLEKQEELLSRKNKKDDQFYNGVYDRYEYLVITCYHISIYLRYGFNIVIMIYFMYSLVFNSSFTTCAIYLNGIYYLVVRTEGLDRKSFFAIAESGNGIDNFRFIGTPLTWEDIDETETNIYDMRLVQHEDGYIYGIYCSESK